MDDQLEKLLPADYFLITFTAPEEIRAFMRAHQRETYNALFAARIIGAFDVAARVAHIRVKTVRCGAAVLDGVHDAELLSRKIMPRPIRFVIKTENIGDFELRTNLIALFMSRWL